MSTPDFSTAENNQELANEVTCLKGCGIFQHC